ncbi:MAG: hypothetical protein QXR84_08435 [Candidatus Bathyarchaeia archaeon]
MSAEKLGDGLLKLCDNTVIRLRVFIIHIKEAGFSPFGGVNFDVKITGGISTQYVPEELKKAVASKPLAPPEPPSDGWEIMDIIEFKPAVTEEDFASSKGTFRIRVVAEPVMASRNMSYKTIHDEPLYWVSWIVKISWKPLRG